jgi:hypothetical protein
LAPIPAAALHASAAERQVRAERLAVVRDAALGQLPVEAPAIRL